MANEYSVSKILNFENFGFNQFIDKSNSNCLKINIGVTGSNELDLYVNKIVAEIKWYEKK